jgi:hypothetical protein
MEVVVQLNKIFFHLHEKALSVTDRILAQELSIFFGRGIDSQVVYVINKNFSQSQ